MSKIYYAFKEIQATVHQLEQQIETNRLCLQKKDEELLEAEQEQYKLENSLYGKRIDSIRILERNTTLAAVLESEKAKCEEINKQIRSLEKEHAELKEELLQFKLLFCQKLGAANREYFQRRMKIRASLFKQFQIETMKQHDQEQDKEEED